MVHEQDSAEGSEPQYADLARIEGRVRQAVGLARSGFVQAVVRPLTNRKPGRCGPVCACDPAQITLRKDDMKRWVVLGFALATTVGVSQVRSEELTGTLKTIKE